MSLSVEHRQLADESEERRRDAEATRDRLAGISAELSQSAGHVAALENAVEAERASHLQTKFSCELLQVS